MEKKFVLSIRIAFRTALSMTMLATPPPATVVERVLMAALENNLGQDLPSRRRTVRIAMMPSFDQPDCASFHFPVIYTRPIGRTLGGA